MDFWPANRTIISRDGDYVLTFSSNSWITLYCRIARSRLATAFREQQCREMRVRVYIYEGRAVFFRSPILGAAFLGLVVCRLLFEWGFKRLFG